MRSRTGYRPPRLLVALFVLAACVAVHRSPVDDGGSAAESRKLAAVIAWYTEAVKHLDPYFAPYFGLEEDLGTFGDYPSPEHRTRAKRTYEDALARLREVRSERLAARDRRTYLLLEEDLAVALRGFDFPQELLAFNQMDNRLLRYMDDSSPDLTDFPFDSVAHYEAFLRRASGFPAYVERQIALLRRGIAERVVHECGIVDAIRTTYAAALESAVERNPFWRPVAAMPATFDASARARLATAFGRVISDVIVPGYRKVDAFLRDEYRPHCRRALGIGGLPRGAEWYAYLIRANTNLPLDASEVHRAGLREVARIRREMDGIRREVGVAGSLEAFLDSWTRAPDHFFATEQAMFDAFRQVKERMARVTPRYFSLRPKSDYEVVAASNPGSPAASYDGPSESIPHGRLILNTKNLQAVPKDRVPTLSLHEAVPGHHFQVALAFEMRDRLSDYQRQIFGSAAFAEGWALYAERLGREMGAYETPMQRLGNLNDEMLRAVRLVVDTGIHAYGWSERRARSYMARNLANDRRDIEIEVGRYAVWPGQALAYKIGEREILALRREAERALGPGFDLREFHDVVLGNGTVSLGVLRRQVEEWLAAKRDGPAVAP